MTSLEYHRLNSLISFEKEHQDVKPPGEGSWKVAGGWEKDMSTGSMKAQGSEEVHFVTAWPCSLPSRHLQVQQHRPGGGNYRVTVAVSLLTSAAVTSKLPVDNVICGNWYHVVIDIRRKSGGT